MKMPLALVLALALAACSQEDAPSDEIAEQAEQIVAPEATAAPVAKGRFAPRDECGELEGAREFRQRLVEAVRLRDADALLALAAEDIQLDFGGGGGTATLRERLTDPDYKLWEELDRLLPLGCAANDEGGVTMPWVWDQDIGDADPYSSMLVLAEDEPVVAGPGAAAEPIASVSWDLVEVVQYDPARALTEIKLADGRTGYVATDKLRAIIDYRLLASSRNGRWRITSFIAGD